MNAQLRSGFDKALVRSWVCKCDWSLAECSALRRGPRFDGALCRCHSLYRHAKRPFPAAPVQAALRLQCNRQPVRPWAWRLMDGNIDPSAHGFLLCARRANARSPDFPPPFTAGSATMGAHCCWIDENLRRRAACFAERTKQIAPYVLFGPPDKAIVQCFVRTVLTARRIHPTAAGLQNMDDPGNHPAVINPRHTARIGRKMRPHLRKLRLRQPKILLAHQSLHSETLNHNSQNAQIILWVRSLGSVDNYRRAMIVAAMLQVAR